MMDLARMLDKCVRDQWTLSDLDWSAEPPVLPRDKEQAVVQAFVDMAGIELLAAALFEVQRDKATDPTLRQIFASFVVDEVRHAAVARRLAEHYDVHHYRTYVESPALTRFRPHFLEVVRTTSPEIANTYITAGEMILDVALLRSLDDYVDDEMSHRAMHLINRDESRHIAVDFHMVEYYCSDAHQAVFRARRRMPLREHARMARNLATMMWHVKPFLHEVFLVPMDRTDPSGRRVQEAFKRLQLLLRKPTVARVPFPRVMIRLQQLYGHPVLGKVFGPLLLRLIGADDRAARILFSRDDLARSQQMSFDELAEDALAVKYRDQGRVSRRRYDPD